MSTLYKTFRRHAVNNKKFNGEEWAKVATVDLLLTYY